ncbi:type 4a pilus biogenesis protein PilO, partial [Candidatus Roizmanbacteria bacterium]|nr:type 4a pilus biogenesis protein PilO [Candidatus Roizmanbacteria bacterium]
IIFIFFAIKPTIETILVLQKKLEDSNQVLKKVNQKANDLSAGKANFEKLPTDVKSRINTAVPDLVQLRSVIQTLEQTAKRHQASVSALQIQPLTLVAKTSNRVGTLSEVTFTFNVEGDYPKLISMLQDFKSSARLISIDSLSIGKLNEGSGLLMSITGKAYYIK